MRRVVKLILLILVGISSDAALAQHADVSEHKQAVLFSPNRRLDFGQLPVSAHKAFAFILENRGTDTLFIDRITSSCACTQVDADERIIAPGANTQLKGNFTSREEAKGKQQESITVYSNARNNPFLLIMDVFVTD